jgi:hypothetical protein
MPNLDKTGPEGKGPSTGKGRGHCGNRKNVEVEQNSKTSDPNEEIIYGRGRGGRPYGGGKGQGLGRRRRRFGNK